MENDRYISSFLDGMRQIADSISRQAIDDVIEALFAVYRRSGTIWVAGNGGSASTATHFVCDLNKATIAPDKPRLRAFGLNDNIPLVSALTNDDGWENVYLEQLRSFFRPGDALVAFSVHGGSGHDQAGPWSQNLLRALEFARENEGVAIGLAGFDGGAMKDLCHHCIVVPYETTPHVESYHVALHHLIAFCLAEKIRDSNVE